MSQRPIENEEQGKAWLEHYGYESIPDFKKSVGLGEGPHLGNKALAAMNAFRCGTKDRGPEIASVCMWPDDKRQLTYYHGRGFNLFKPLLGHADGKKASAKVLADAFMVWSANCPFLFTRSHDVINADIVIGGGSTEADGFDGPGNVLAWADRPCGAVRQCRFLFDTSENWTNAIGDPGPPFPALAVALHEIGHLLGLTHSEDQNDVMYPFYNLAADALGPGDITRIQALYPT